jgi:ElaB/YqjD/DUF883 family membrane-anchored ribosome-binding protein
MGQSTEELTSDIASTREGLAQNLDALQDRVSPSAIVERRKDAAKGRFRQVRNKVMGTAQGAKHSAGSTASSATDSVTTTAQGAVGAAGEKFEGSPLAAGLIAFGAGMVVSALLPASDAETKAARGVVESAQPMVDEMTSVGQELGQQVKESATGAAQQVKDAAAESAQNVKAEGQSSAQNVQSEAKQQL